MTIPGRKTAYRLYGKMGGPVIDVMIRLSPWDDDNSKAPEAPTAERRMLCCDPFDSKRRYDKIIWAAYVARFTTLLLRAYITPSKVEELQRLYFCGGQVVRDLPSIAHIRQYVEDQVANFRAGMLLAVSTLGRSWGFIALLADHLRPLNPTPYKVSVSESLYEEFHHLWEASAPIKDISNLNVVEE